MPSMSHGETGNRPCLPISHDLKHSLLNAAGSYRMRGQDTPSFPSYSHKEDCKVGNAAFSPPQGQHQLPLPVTPSMTSMAYPWHLPPPSFYRSPWALLPLHRGKGQLPVIRGAGKAASSSPTRDAVALPSVVRGREAHNKSFHLSL